MFPVVVTGIERLLDQQAAEAGAIDEQVAFDDLARLQADRGDIACVRILLDEFDLAFLPHGAVFLGQAAQELRVQRCVDVVGVVQPQARHDRELVLHRGGPFVAIFAELASDAHLQAFQPEMLETRRPTVLAGPTEGMDIVLVDVAPAFELDAELEGALGRLEEILLLDLDQIVKGDQRRDGRFADADRADLFGFHQGDVQRLAEQPRQGRGGHPAGGAAAGDDNLVDLSILHFGTLRNRQRW